MIMDFQIIVLDQFKPSSLPHVNIGLSEDILETLVISINITMIPKKIVAPNLQSVDNSRKLEIMRWVILLVVLQLA